MRRVAHECDLVRLTEPLSAGGRILDRNPSPDGSIVAYLMETDGTAGSGLFAVRVAGGVSRPLSAPLVPGGAVQWFDFTPDGARAIYGADQAVDELVELFATDLVPDADGDGVLSFCECDDHDPSSRPGAVDLPGDRLDQDCDGVLLCDPAATYSGHGQFVACVVREATVLASAGRISEAEKRALVRDAASSGAGKP